MPGAGNPQLAPSGAEGTLNRYSYVLNNPLRYTDPSGRIPVDASGQPLVSPGQYVVPSLLPPLAPCDLSYFCSQVVKDYSWAMDYLNTFLPYSGGGLDTGIIVVQWGWGFLGIPEPFIPIRPIRAPAVRWAPPVPKAAAAAESPGAIVQRVAREETSRGVSYLKSKLSEAELRAFDANPAGGSRFLGQAAHRATFQALRALFPRRFDYHPSQGPDFYDTWTGQWIELTTPGQAAAHAAAYPNAIIVTYTLPREPPPPWLR